MPYEIFIGTGVFALSTLLFAIFIDYAIKYNSNLGFKKTKFIKLGNNEISVFKLVIIILFIIINLTWILLLVIYIVMDENILFIVSAAISYLNLFLLLVMGIKISLNDEQRKIKEADIARRKLEKNKQ